MAVVETQVSGEPQVGREGKETAMRNVVKFFEILDQVSTSNDHEKEAEKTDQGRQQDKAKRMGQPTVKVDVKSISS